ncbi:MAG: NAD regulator [Alphaproteobacteria bacterium]|nr:NAD regulator [Alphaproteobacteria bacterium]
MTNQSAISIGLSAAIVSVENGQPCALVVTHVDGEDSLPFGPFDPGSQRTLEQGLRKWVEEQTHFDLGYTEQLYTFGDHGRHLPAIAVGNDTRLVSVGYLALTRQGVEDGTGAARDTRWRGWYHYFPWEDWRQARPGMIDAVILPRLKLFAKAAPDAKTADQRRDRIRLCFGTDGVSWDDEKVLERYELLYEAGLIQEFARDNGNAAEEDLGAGMMFDHRRILATAIARLRGKMKYRPVVFELMAPSFTLLELQRTVEALLGFRLHKQNFRRLVAEQGLVEGTGKFAASVRGRPAELFRFRREVLRERPAPGLRLGARR